MSFATNLRCRECHRESPLEATHVCDFCFAPVEVAYDYEGIRNHVTRESIQSGPASLWRYRDFLPCDADARIDIGAGYTPLIHAKNLGKALGLPKLYIKNDTVNPTWSFKDRVVAVASTRAREMGYEKLACASTGNLANSVSAHAAAGGMEAVVFIPDNLESGKVLGSSIYAPTLVQVNGNYDAVNRLCAELSGSYNWGFVNVNVRPYYSEGSKTLGFEVAEQHRAVRFGDNQCGLRAASLFLVRHRGLELERADMLADRLGMRRQLGANRPGLHRGKIQLLPAARHDVPLTVLKVPLHD